MCALNLLMTAKWLCAIKNFEVYESFHLWLNVQMAQACKNVWCVISAQ